MYIFLCNCFKQIYLYSFLVYVLHFVAIVQKLQNSCDSEKNIFECCVEGLYSVTTVRSGFLESRTPKCVQSVYERLVSTIAGFDVLLN